MDADLNAADMGKIVGRFIVYALIVAGIVYAVVKVRKNKSKK